MSQTEEFANVKMPSGEIRMIRTNCMATIGRVGNVEHNNIVMGKAGRKRWLGIRPTVRGVAMNPVDHPMGGGEGRTSGGGHPKSPWGLLSKGNAPVININRPVNILLNGGRSRYGTFTQKRALR